MLVGLVAASCVTEKPALDVPAPREDERGEREQVRPFAFDSLDERPVSRDTFRGKPAVILFLTTWDLTSQAEATVLGKLAERDGPKVAYAIVALHDRHERELVEAYARSLKVTFPVALGDDESRVGRGPLGDVHMIPTTVVLDADGRLVKKHVGFQRPEVLRASIEAAKAGGRAGVGVSGR